MKMRVPFRNEVLHRLPSGAGCAKPLRRGSDLTTNMVSMMFLHTLAWVALRVGSPRTARKFTARAGRLFSPMNLPELRRADRILRSRGTCLSRSLALAARAAEASVVIGVDRRPSARLSAHAWVEVGHAPLNVEDRQGTEIVRL